MEETAQVDKELHQNVKSELQQAGHDIETVEPPTSDTPLELAEHLPEFLGQEVDAVKRWAGGGGPGRTVSSNSGLSMWKDRVKSMLKPNQQLVEKAA